MNIFITNNCINCGACVQVNSTIFEITKNGVIYNKEKYTEEFSDDLYDAIYSCPVNAIHLY